MPDCGVLFDELDIAAAPRELIAVGGAIDPPTLRAAYRNGVFPWPSGAGESAVHDRALRRLIRKGEVPALPGGQDGPLVPWVSPHPRAVLLTDRVVVPRSLRRLMAACGWQTTVDVAFAEVIRRCADRPEGTWITPQMIAGYVALHHDGGAHSLEVWDGKRLVGGLYGVLSGRVFSGESMFFVESGASKVAVVDLCRRLATTGVRVLDTQQESAHLQALGQVLVDRREYVEVVRSLQADQVTVPSDQHAVSV